MESWDECCLSSSDELLQRPARRSISWANDEVQPASVILSNPFNGSSLIATSTSGVNDEDFFKLWSRREYPIGQADLRGFEKGGTRSLARRGCHQAWCRLAPRDRQGAGRE